MLKAGRQNEPFIFTFETKKDIQATHGAETALSNKIMVITTAANYGATVAVGGTTHFNYN